MSLLPLALSAIRFALGVLSDWNGIVAWFAAQAGMRAGANAQAAAETRESEAAFAGIAQAEASAPRTDDAVDTRLKDHSI